MLLALALGGLAAAFAAPVLMSSQDDDDDYMPEPEDGASPDVGALLAGGADVETGDLYEFAAAPGDFEIEGFDPELDSCLVRLDDPDALIETGWEEDGTPYLLADTAEGAMTLLFPGLEAVPADAVSFALPEGDDGEPLKLSVSDILALGADHVAGLVTQVLDHGDERDFSDFDTPLVSDEEMLLVLPEPGDVTEDATGLLDDLVPLDPVAADAVDAATGAVDDLPPIGPADPQAPDSLPEPLTGTVPLAPTAPEAA